MLLGLGLLSVIEETSLHVLDSGKCSLISRAECLYCREFGLHNHLPIQTLPLRPSYLCRLLFSWNILLLACFVLSMTNFLMFFLFFLTWYPDLNRNGVKETCLKLDVCCFRVFGLEFSFEEKHRNWLLIKSR